MSVDDRLSYNHRHQQQRQFQLQQQQQQSGMLQSSMQQQHLQDQKLYADTAMEMYGVPADSDVRSQEQVFEDGLERLIAEQSNTSKLDTVFSSDTDFSMAAAAVHIPSPDPPAPGTHEQSFLPSPFLHQDYMSMMGYNNPVLMRQAISASNHVLTLPIHDDNLQQLVPEEPCVMRSSKRGFFGSRFTSPYETASSSGRGTCESVGTDKKKRFNRTRDALEKSGLMGITMKTADLMKSNEGLEKEIFKLKLETETLLKSILLNPGNEKFRKKYGKSIEKS